MVHNFLEIQNTTFVASKLNKVLDFNLTIKNEGDIICLLGPSGIGKTTILRSIAGLQKIPKGSISLKGKILSSEKKFFNSFNDIGEVEEKISDSIIFFILVFSKI